MCIKDLSLIKRLFILQTFCPFQGVSSEKCQERLTEQQYLECETCLMHCYIQKCDFLFETIIEIISLNLRVRNVYPFSFTVTLTCSVFEEFNHSVARIFVL